MNVYTSFSTNESVLASTGVDTIIKSNDPESVENSSDPASPVFKAARALAFGVATIASCEVIAVEQPPVETEELSLFREKPLDGLYDETFKHVRNFFNHEKTSVPVYVLELFDGQAERAAQFIENSPGLLEHIQTFIHQVQALEQVENVRLKYFHDVDYDRSTVFFVVNTHGVDEDRLDEFEDYLIDNHLPEAGTNFALSVA